MATGLANLKIYQMASALEIQIHQTTQKFPKDERYRSVDQLRRSSSAVSNNIAEAYNKQSVREKVHILRDIAISEAEETESNILRCAEKDFINADDAAKIASAYVEL